MRRLCILIAFSALAAAAPSQAATFEVGTTADGPDDVHGDGACLSSGAGCTLRAAVQEANALAGDDRIDVPAGRYVLTGDPDEDESETGDLDVFADEPEKTRAGATGGGALVIAGAGARSAIVDANGVDRVFDIHSDMVVTIEGLTITGGDQVNQGGGINNNGVLTLRDSAVSGNRVDNFGFIFGGQGGGIFNNLEMTIERVLVSGNTAGAEPGEFSGGQGGGIFNNDVMTLTNSTLSGNTAVEAPGASFEESEGGGLFQNSDIVLVNNTIAGNSSRQGPGIFLNDDTTFRNMIVAGNSGTEAPGDQCFQSSGDHTSLGGNIDGSASCSMTGGPGDRQNTDPAIGALADNGGPTDTHALLEGSPAIDTATSDGCPATDQRGVARPQFAGCDVGAFEVAPAPAPPAAPQGAAPVAQTRPSRPRVRVAGLRRACVSRSLRFSVRVTSGARLTSVRVLVDGRRVRSLRRSRFTVRLSVRRLSAGSHRLRIEARDSAGNRSVVNRRFAKCSQRPRRRAAPRFTG